jgi:hypothetical protein
MSSRTMALMLFPLLCVGVVAQQPPDWQIHSNWCANVDNGSSHKVYMSTCACSDQYDSVLACQRDAGQNNGDGGAAVRAIENAGRQNVNSYMENNKPAQCRSSYGPPPAGCGR